jgi:hypothetical protein
MNRAARTALVLAMLALTAPGMGRAAEPPGQRWGLPERTGLYAISPPNIFYHNVGLLELMVTNVGIIGNPNFVDSYGAGWRGGEYLYAASLWIGAIASDNLPYVSTGAYEVELRPSLEPIDTMYPAYEGIQGGNRPGFSAQPDDDNDGEVDEDFPNGKDDDRDGLIDEDYSAISQQMYTCEYWDYTEEAQNTYPEHRPLNLRMEQKSFAWSTEGSNEFVGFDFQIFNDGFEVLKELYIGFFVDSDAGPKDTPGYFSDDRGAFYSRDTTIVDVSNRYSCTERTGAQRQCDTQKMRLDMCYMYDVPDNGTDATSGDVPGFFGGMFLGHTTDPLGVRGPERVEIFTAAFFSGSGAYPAGDPRNDFERYDLLKKGTKPNRPTTSPSDYRYLFSAGPFNELNPGERLELQTAFVIGQGQRGMLINAVNAQRIYNGAWRDVDNNAGTPPATPPGRETCLFVPEGATPPLLYRDECDSLNPQVLQIKETVCIPENYVDADCDCCTPLYRNPDEADDGFEGLIHWVGTVAPPPPSTNIDEQQNQAIVVKSPAGNRRVLLQWDNLSELSADPIQQKILFSGYRVWRVEGWDRPTGSTGPAPQDWQLIADLSVRPADDLGEDSPFYLGRYLRPPPEGPDSLYEVPTGVDPILYPNDVYRWYYPPGRYEYVDSLGLKNGMVYFYDVTAYSAWIDDLGRYNELAGRPTASETDAVVPVWDASMSGDEIIVVPNPYVRGGQPAGWDLNPSDRDPTGTKIAFANLPRGNCSVSIYTLSGDLVQTLQNDGRRSGTAFWNLISRNGQDIVSGVYIYAVECKECEPGVKGCEDRKIGRFAVIR